jgi:hypothetical protein
MKYILMMNGTKSDFGGYAKWSKDDIEANVASCVASARNSRMPGSTLRPRV